MNKKLGLITLTLFIAGSVDSIRNLPATAIFGSDILFFLVMSAVLFLIPCALICAELASMDQQQAGVYAWVKKAFGPKMSMLAVWLQWINTMIWFPTILSFLAAVVLHLINPGLANNKYVLIAIIVTVFWGLTLINLKGIHVSGRFASWCGILGMALPMTFIILLGATWLVLGKPLQISVSPAHLVPDFRHMNSWISLTAIMTAFLGMELTAVHIKDIKEAKKTFPKALAIGVTFIIITMLAGALAIAIVIPANKLSLIDGIMQTFSYYLAVYHLSFLVPVLGAMIFIGALGGMVNWMVSPAKGLLQAAQDGFIPQRLAQQNAMGVPSAILILQAVLVTLACSAFLFMPSVNGSYWLLTDLSTQLYMLMYLIMFLAGLSLGLKWLQHHALTIIPGGKFGLCLVALLGATGTLVTMIVGFIPPSTIAVGGLLHYETMFIGGIFLLILPVLYVIINQRDESSRLQLSI